MTVPATNAGMHSAFQVAEYVAECARVLEKTGLKFKACTFLPMLRDCLIQNGFVDAVSDIYGHAIGHPSSFRLAHIADTEPI